eukprot:scaffold757_cov246-Pinguiococcus_pyrenoidosus.AAC.21
MLCTTNTAFSLWHTTVNPANQSFAALGVQQALGLQAPSLHSLVDLHEVLHLPLELREVPIAHFEDVQRQAPVIRRHVHALRPVVHQGEVLDDFGPDPVPSDHVVCRLEALRSSHTDAGGVEAGLVVEQHVLEPALGVQHKLLHHGHRAPDALSEVPQRARVALPDLQPGGDDAGHENNWMLLPEPFLGELEAGAQLALRQRDDAADLLPHARQALRHLQVLDVLLQKAIVAHEAAHLRRLRRLEQQHCRAIASLA